MIILHQHRLEIYFNRKNPGSKFKKIFIVEWNRSFFELLLTSFQSQTKSKTIYMKISYFCMQLKTNNHIKDLHVVSL